MAKAIINRVEGCPTIPWDELRTWTFNALKPDRRDVSKLKTAIVDEGFCFPLFVWEPGRYVFDGTGRKIALDELAGEEHQLPEIPVVKITADDLEAAKRLALMASSEHGRPTQESFDKFVAGISVEALANIGTRVNFEGIKIQTPNFAPVTAEEQGRLDQTSKGAWDKAARVLKCPSCGHEFQ